MGGPVDPDNDYFNLEEEISSSSSTTSTTTDRPHVFPTRPTVIGFDEEGKKITLHQAAPENVDNFVRASGSGNSPSDLDLAKIFTEGNLVMLDWTMTSTYIFIFRMPCE